MAAMRTALRLAQRLLQRPESSTAKPAAPAAGRINLSIWSDNLMPTLSPIALLNSSTIRARQIQTSRSLSTTGRTKCTRLTIHQPFTKPSTIRSLSKFAGRPTQLPGESRACGRTDRPRRRPHRSVGTGRQYANPSVRPTTARSRERQSDRLQWAVSRRQRATCSKAELANR